MRGRALRTRLFFSHSPHNLTVGLAWEAGFPSPSTPPPSPPILLVPSQFLLRRCPSLQFFLLTFAEWTGPNSDPPHHSSFIPALGMLRRSMHFSFSFWSNKLSAFIFLQWWKGGEDAAKLPTCFFPFHGPWQVLFLSAFLKVRLN